MLKALAIVGALLTGSAALAGVGTPPTPSNGPGLVDGTWLNGLAGGLNNSYQNAIAALGSAQSTAAQLPSGIELMEVDTATNSTATGIALPFCFQGTEFNIYNNTGVTLTAYPNNTNNPITAAQDTINNSTTFSMSGHTPYYFACAKNGVWSAK